MACSPNSAPQSTSTPREPVTASADAPPPADAPRSASGEVPGEASGQASSQPAPAGDATVVARLTALPTPMPPNCGIWHVGAVMDYELVRVISGTLDKKRFHVVHGCPELRRSQYDKSGGTLTVFHAGDLHRLELSTKPPAQPPSIFNPVSGVTPYWCRRVDPADAAP
jgi:hypothetical protein